MTLPAVVVEHGQTARDALGLAHGPDHAGEPLNRVGRQQAVRLGARLREMAAKRIYSSPAKRASMTARIAAAVAGGAVSEHPELRSLDTGTISGGDEKAVARRLKPYFDDPSRRIPGGESVDEFRQRHLSFMRRVAGAHRARGEPPPVFVTHSNVVGSAKAAATGGTADEARRAMAHPPAAAQPLQLDLGRRLAGSRKP